MPCLGNWAEGITDREEIKDFSVTDPFFGFIPLFLVLGVIVGYLVLASLWNIFGKSPKREESEVAGYWIHRPKDVDPYDGARVEKALLTFASFLESSCEVTLNAEAYDALERYYRGALMFAPKGPYREAPPRLPEPLIIQGPRGVIYVRRSGE